MRTKSVPNTSAMGRPRLTLWLRRYTSRRWSAVVTLLVGARVFAIGCGPGPGEKGGKCKDDGCSNPYCDNHLRCDYPSNKCVDDTYSPSGACGPTPECHPIASIPDCASDIAWRCTGGESPTGTCNRVSTDDAGGDVYCCEPQCWAGFACAAPASSYRCEDPLSPEDGDAGLACLRFLPDFPTHTYCCAPADTCFQGPSGDLVLPCASSSEQYFCSGAAAPSSADIDCVAVPNDAGSALKGYCCTQSDAGREGGAVEGGR
jgi:hypothetical protein